MSNSDRSPPGEQTTPSPPPPQGGTDAEQTPPESPPKTRKTFWHYPYAALIRERMPPGWELVVEYDLSLSPRAADLLLLRRQDTERRDHQARVMRGLWPHLTDVVLLEFKGPTAGLRQRDLCKLMSYGWEYLSEHDCPAHDESELSLVMVLPEPTPTLWQECERWKLTPAPLSDGYVRLLGKRCTMVLVLLDQVADAEHDDFIRLFTSHRRRIHDPQAIKWIHERLREVLSMDELKHGKEYSELVASFIETLGPDIVLSKFAPEERVAGLAPEERVAGLAPEERVAGLAPEERVAGLAPEERVAGLAPEERIAGLAPAERIADLSLEQLKQLQAALEKKLNS